MPTVSGKVNHTSFLGLNKPPLNASLIALTAQIIHADISATSTIELQKKRAFRATLQHASALTKPEILLRLTAFIAFRGKYGHDFSPREFVAVS
jgi:hypothetical protein